MAKVAKRGVLLPLFSLWSRKYHGGYLDLAKYFIDWLSENNFNVWQLLPISATSWKVWPGHFSPYSNYGVGLNPLFLSEKQRNGPFPQADTEFLEKNKDWIYDYGFFCTLSEKYGTDDWREWPKEFRQMKSGSVDMAGLGSELSERVQFYIKQQSLIWLEFRKLHSHAQNRGVELWGDMPFYLPIRSPLFWKNQDTFLIHNGKVEFVAGALADKHFGKRQVWGFPLYRFDTKRGTAKSLRLWKQRISYYSQLFDNCRLDAAIRFFTYEKISVTDPELDRLQKGPGEDFITDLVKLSRKLGMDVYAEDISGLDMTDLYRVCTRLKVSVLSVFTMIFTPGKTNIKPTDFNLRFPPNHLYFSSTHDTLPMLAYIDSLSSRQKETLADVFSIKVSSSEQMTEKIKKFLDKNAKNYIIAMQDILNSRVRINIPSIENINNWTYRTEVPVESLPRGL